MTRALERSQGISRQVIDNELVRPWDLSVMTPPVSFPQSIFTRYRHREGVLALSCAAVAYLMPATAMLVGVASFGVLGGAVATMIGAFVAAWMLDQTGMLGNFRMRQELARKLRVDEERADFVGIGLPENNSFAAKYLQPRLDSDDNVGFLVVNGEQLSVLTEEGRLEIARDEIRKISTERLVELPYLHWIRIDYYKGDALLAVLVSSRHAETLWELRDATADLHKRLVNWWTEPVAQELLLKAA